MIILSKSFREFHFDLIQSCLEEHWKLFLWMPEASKTMIFSVTISFSLCCVCVYIFCIFDLYITLSSYDNCSTLTVETYNT